MLKIYSLKNLERLLTSNGVDISTWGKGSAKTLSHLLQELIKKECTIYVREGRVVRGVHALSINVIFKDEILKEEYQKFKDGRIRRRKMDCSVAEKLNSDEINDADNSVSRAMAEELQIYDIKNNQIKGGEKASRSRESDSYPGTLMDITLYRYDVTLQEHQYNPYGYVEHQEDKDTFFVWVKKI